MSVMPQFGRQRQKDQEFKASPKLHNLFKGKPGLPEILSQNKQRYKQINE